MSLSRRVARFVAGRLMPRGIAYPVLCGPLRGARFYLGAAAGPGGGASLFVDRMEPGRTRAFAQAVKPGHVVYDVGANVGAYTVLASRRVGAAGFVVALEPSLRNLTYLQRHLAVNRVMNAVVIPAACSDGAGLERFTPDPNPALGRLEATAPDHDTGTGTWAPCVTLDAVVAATRRAPHVVKIDVEGAELRVLHGARDTLRRARPVLFLSCHSDVLSRACGDLLRDAGYALASIEDGGEEFAEYQATPT